MRLGYKGKISGKGMRLGYTSDKVLGMDDNQFAPADFMLIPRAQNHIILAYSNRCSVDMWFLKDKMIKVKSAQGVPVKSCSSDEGSVIQQANFAEKLQALCNEMASL